MSKKKQKVIRVTNGKFVTVVKEDAAVITINDSGIARLYFEDRDEFFMMPDGVPITDDLDGQYVAVTMRQGFDTPLLTLGPDDVREEDLEADDSLVPVTDLEEIEDLATEYRMQALNKHSTYIVNTLAGIALAVVSGICIAQKSAIAQYAIISLIGGVACALVAGVLPFIGMLSKLSTKIVADRYGNTVNLQTGECSLNGGCTLKTSEE